MLQTFFLAVCLVFFCDYVAAAKQATPQSLEEINADLKARKAALEPFDQKKVKIDLESLGLDDFEKKPAEKKPETSPAEVKMPEPPAAVEAPTPNPITPTTAPIAVPAESNAAQNKAPEVLGAVSKIQNFLSKKSNSPEEIAKDQPNKPEEKFVKSQKKKNLKKLLEAKKKKEREAKKQREQREKSEKEEREKLKKLQELREKYLKQVDENFAPESGENFAADDEKIVPREKEINRFISDEMPAPPILNYFRTADNLHIPRVLTVLEKIEILFGAISSGNIAFFNSAYQNVENPNAKNQLGDTILTYSILLQRHAVMASVLAKGANPDMLNNLGYSPIDIAIEMLDGKALELLINHGADSSRVDAFGRTYLMHAARVGFLPAVDLLLANGADVNAMDNDGFTALSIAYRHKKEIIVKYLLANGAKTWVEKPFDPGNQSLIKELENRWN
jgi:hypothetical protein